MRYSILALVALVSTAMAVPAPAPQSASMSSASWSSSSSSSDSTSSNSDSSSSSSEESFSSSDGTSVSSAAASSSSAAASASSAAASSSSAAAAMSGGVTSPHSVTAAPSKSTSFTTSTSTSTSTSGTATGTASPSPTAVVGQPIERTANFSIAVANASSPALNGLIVALPPSPPATGTNASMYLASASSPAPLVPATAYISGDGDEFTDNAAELYFFAPGSEDEYSTQVSSTGASPSPVSLFLPTDFAQEEPVEQFGVDSQTSELRYVDEVNSSGMHFLACKPASPVDGAQYEVFFGPDSTPNCSVVKLYVTYETPE